MAIRTGVSLILAWGGVFRGDLQPRAKARERSLMQGWREGMLCRKIAVVVSRTVTSSNVKNGSAPREEFWWPCRG